MLMGSIPSLLFSGIIADGGGGNRRLESRRHRPFPSLQRCLAMVVAMCASFHAVATAFISPSLGSLGAKSLQPRSDRLSTSLFYRDEDTFGALGVDRAPFKEKASAKPPSDFQSRMKGRVLRRNRSTSRKVYQPENMMTAESLEEFANIIEKGRREDRVVAVRFTASWCKKCHSLVPSFLKASRSHPQVIFVEVPVLATNYSLHQGLGVESVPFGHIYHPREGLVEETNLSRETFAKFEESVERQCRAT